MTIIIDRAVKAILNWVSELKERKQSKLSDQSQQSQAGMEFEQQQVTGPNGGKMRRINNGFSFASHRLEKGVDINFQPITARII